MNWKTDLNLFAHFTRLQNYKWQSAGKQFQMRSLSLCVCKKNVNVHYVQMHTDRLNVDPIYTRQAEISAEDAME